MLEGFRPESTASDLPESKSQYKRLENVEDQSPSLGGLSVKITNGRVPVFEIVLIRSGLCMAITIGMMKVRGISSPVFGSRENYLPLLVRGAAGAASMSLYYFAIFQMTLAEVMTVFYTHPAMVVALAWACRGEAVSRAALGGMLASLVGVVVVAQPPFLTGGSEWSPEHVSGVVNSLLAALLAAVAFVAIRFVAKGESSMSIAMWFHTMGVISSIIPLAVGKPDHAVLPSAMDSALLCVVAFCSFTSHTFIARAFQVENAAKSAAAGYLQVVFGYLYGVFIFHDSHSIIGVLGSALICIGVVAVSWPARAHDASESQPADLVTASKQGSMALQDYTVLELTPVDEEEDAPKTPPPLPASKIVPGLPT